MNDAAKPLVLLCGKLHPAGMKLLQEDERIRPRLIDDSTAALEEHLPEAAGLVLRLTRLTEAMLERAPHLKVVSRHGVGCDNVPVAYLTSRGIPVLTTGDANSLTVAEHAILLMLAVARQLRALDAAARAGNWQARSTTPTFELAGRRLLIVGCGRIGRLLVPRAQALGMEVSVYDPHLPAAEFDALGVVRQEDLDAALPHADVVSLHLPSLGKPVLGAAQLAALPDQAAVINVARGDLIDEQALHAALTAGKLAGAGLDVLAQEPFDPKDPLLQLDNVVVSPHSAALTRDSLRRMGITCVRNAIEVACGARPDPAMVFNPGWDAAASA